MKYYEFETTEYPISYYLAKEEYLLTKNEEAFFIWNNKPGIVIGKNQVLDDEVNVAKAKEDNIPIYRRKSGGGAVYADSGCFMFTFIVKKDVISNIYASCLRKIYKVLKLAGVKCEIGERNDILVDGAKISGNAIYLKSNYAIMHGSILYDSKLEDMAKYLTPSKEKLAKNKVASVKSRVTNLKGKTDYTKLGLMNFFQKTIGTTKGRLFESEEKVFERLALRYEEEAWLRGKRIETNYKVSKRFPCGQITFNAKLVKNVIEEVIINGDFFENYDIRTLEHNFLGARVFEIGKVIDKLTISKFIYGITNDEFKSLFMAVEEKKKDMLEKRTCLYKNHIRHNAKMVEFGGFLMPLEYTSISEEHFAVRNDAGVFDCSHMGQIKVSGADTMDFLNYILTCDVKSAQVNHMVYGMMLYQDGTVVDDLMVYKYKEDECMLVVNASNTDKDYANINKYAPKFNVKIENLSDECGELALQGPKAINYFYNFTRYNLDSLKFFTFDYFEIDGTFFNVSRSGYTGSDGFEIYGKNKDIVKLFEDLIESGVTPCGLGCRDTLRFEAAMPLYGHEISDQITPLEAGLNYAVSFDKGNFIGREVLVKQKEAGVKKKLVGLELKERGIARSGYKLFKDGKEIGYITTGYMIPGTQNSYALGYVTRKNAKIGTEVEVQIRNRLVKMEVRDKKFLKKEYVK
ncbi:MAG: glycine cleavage system aminomethyltransferase GcvT [Bacilli bacterium]|nr:glycine cleavage system aminomethyltransferase GcvT [Bacilli bacterium]